MLNQPAKVSHAQSFGFPHFPNFPTEVRLLIWRFAIPVDFNNTPISVKPYSYTYRDRRIPPKTLHVNQESRHETLKYFRRLELRAAEISSAVKPLHKVEWLRHYPSQFILWDNTTDILTLDWWCLVSTVTEPIKYLNLQPFVDTDQEKISCVQILDIDTQACHHHNGLHRLSNPLSRGFGPHIIGIIEKKLQYFVRLKEVRLSMWDLRRTYDDERYFMGVLEDCFKRLANNNPGYCIPIISLVPEVENDIRRLLR
jgi:2EXR family